MRARVARQSSKRSAVKGRATEEETMAQRQTGDSSVVISLAELLKMEEQRRAEVVERERTRVADEQRRAVEAEAKKRAEEEQQRALAADRQRADTLRAAVDDAAIEAAKIAQIEYARLAVQIRIQADQLAAREAHARELAAILEKRVEKRSLSSLLLVVLAVVAAVVTIGAVVLAMQKRPEPVVVEKTVVTAPSYDDTMNEIDRLKREVEKLNAAASAQPTVIAAPKPAPVTAPVIKKEEPQTKVNCTGIAWCPGQ
jgi:hypothetical protein